MIDYAATIEALEEALGTGTLSVTVNGRTVAYKSTADIVAALSYFRGRVAASAGERPVDRLGMTLLKG